MSFKDRLCAGEPLIGTFLKTPSPMVCEVLGRTDCDAVCIDAEHAPFDRRDIDVCIHALEGAQKPSIVRIPALRSEYILNALDCGAEAILAPHIASAEDAEFLVNQSTYGRGRGFAGSSRAAGYMARGMAEHIETSNAGRTVIAQLEDKEALDNLDAILAVEGIDCFFIGRADLTVSLGLNNPNDAAVIEAVEHICRSAVGAGRRVGMFTSNLDEIPRWRKLGATLFLLGSDHSMMLEGANSLTSKVRAHF
ncbi:HpcH/HpaI aldolase/citrate lyase family protein [Erythrobacter sp. MTPC3]|uniref:HpcH/HpaI aldolase family protein n=1 Tax=Erythrobacter sp. MTPC3 TaxID=3056564 RepID=UPI0036F240D6